MARRKKERSALRRIPTYELRVFDDATGQELGMLYDVSVNGARVRGPHALRTGTDFALRIELPEGCGDADAPTRELRVLARCAWCEREPRTRLQIVGFEFRAMPRESEALLAELSLRRSA